MPSRSRFQLGPRGRSMICLLALALPLTIGCKSAPESGSKAEGETVWDGTKQAKIAKIRKIRGSRGVRSPELPEGAFLGEGAALHAGQWLELPRGTRVEVELDSGQRLRLDENTRLRLPSKAEQTDLVIERGRLVVLAADHGAVEVEAADDRLVIERGEVELHHAGDTRHFGVVQGRAVLHTAGREIPLGPGASISTPATPTTRPEAPVDPNILAAALQPQLSLAPLEEAAWAASFEETTRIADDLPEGVGSLVARRAGSKVERQSLRLTEQKVKVTISGRIARTEIEQAFHNDSGQTLEGIYQFPLPTDASISDLQLLVGDTWMRGEMLEKQRARQIFRQIVDATVPRDPALLQWDKGSVFKLNIFPIPGKGERRIKIAYTQVLPAVGDSLRYRYPMGGSGATATEIGEFSFDVEIAGADPNAALAKVGTPMAELAKSITGDRMILSMRERDYQPTHELGVDVPLPEDERRVLAATHRDRDGQGYFMLTLEPTLELEADPRPVHYAFVLDRSHGTSKDLWAAATELTKSMLGTLEPEDRFTVLACDTACDRLGGGLRSAHEGEAPRELDRFLSRQQLAGASDIGNMLKLAGASLEPLPGGRLEGEEPERVIVYLGDGVPTSGALTPDELGTIAREQLGRLRVQAVALGARSDLLVLDHLVRQSGGDLIQADVRDDLDTIARELRLRAQVPVARDLSLDLPPGLTDVYPRSIPALRPGDSLTLVGKLAEGDPKALRGDVRLWGRGPAGQVDERFQVMLDAEYSRAGGVHAHLPRTWAQHEITHLTQTEGAAARDRIVELSREFNVLSRFTALLVLENDRMYREFNVARRAKDKDAWDGELGEDRLHSEDEPRPDASATSKTTEVPVEEEREKNEEAKLPGGSAAPSSIPSAEPSRERGAGPADGSGAADFDPLAPAEAPDDRRDELAFDEAEEAAFDELDGFEDDFGDFEGGEVFGGDNQRISDEGGSSRSGGSASGGSSREFAPAPPPEKKRKKKPSRRASQDPDIDCLLDDSLPACRGSGWGGGGGHGWQGQPVRRPQILVRNFQGPSAADRARVTELLAARDRKPSDRKAHRDLVRRAIRDGHESALAFAAAWAEADPDHAPALLAHADQLAAVGDPLALRSYASAIEVEPFSTRMHRRLADALTSAGDFDRACSHRRALVSIDPSNGKDAAKLVECYVQAGRSEDARGALAQARETVSSSSGKKALAKAERAVEAGFIDERTSFLHSNPELRAELRWVADENLDIAFVDRRGRRLSVLRPQGVAIREQRDGAERVEIMTLRRLQGTVFIEVTRAGSRSEERVPATLTIKSPGSNKTFRVQLDEGTRRVASARWR